jgi:putative phosphoribosyl transferase
MDTVYRDRRHAGRALGEALAAWAGRPDVSVLALPRGGVPVAFEVAQRLRAPLDVLVVRKLGVPGHAEYAMGAIASGGVRVLDEEVVRSLRIAAPAIDAVVQQEQAELARRDALYRAGRAPPAVRGRTVIVVDDGLATGSTMRAAVRALRAQAPAAVVAAAPTGSASACETLRAEADTVVCPSTPEPYRAVGCWYAEFDPTSDDEVRVLLAQAASRFS